MQCPICGSEIPENNAFCINCGNKIPRCPTCGRAVGGQMRFCVYDGTPLPDDVIAAVPGQSTAAAKSAPASLPAGGFNNGPIYEGNSNYGGGRNQNQQPPGKKSGKKWLIIVIIAAAVLIAAAAAAVVLFYLNSGKISQKEEQSTEIVVQDETETQEDLSEETQGEQESAAQETAETQETQTQEDYLDDLPSPVIQSATATSELSEYGMTHTASRVIDGDLTTGWAEGASGQGIGESITLTLEQTSRIEGFTIYAGYQKSDESYEKNSRPEQITLYFSDGTEYSLILSDVYGAQTIMLPEAVAAESVTITIDSVYEGSKYEDTVITEIEFY